MRLWLLKARRELPQGDDPWNPWYDKNFGLVIRAETEERARKIAQDNSADESRGAFLGRNTSETTAPWLYEKYSSCEELACEGDEEVLLIDHWSA